jgi:hypothetical protein
MKHIKDILAERKSTLFAPQGAKGSSEWSAFNSVREDRIEMFPVASARERTTPRYTNVVHISRYPRRLTPKFGN